MIPNRAFGDANLNGQGSFQVNPADDDYDYRPKRRSTRHNLLLNKNQAHHYVFKAFTRESLINIRKRKCSIASSIKSQSNANKKVSSDIQANVKLKPTEPDPYLASGQQLPPALIRQLPAELIGRPIEDIDPYYADQETFVIISRGKELTRFSASNALYLFGPFHSIRKIVLYILVNPIFNLLVILTILINCILMTIQGSEMIENTEIIFTIIYTTEMGLKVLARGFIMDNFTYLRDSWNWLDFAVIIMAYLTIVVQDLGNLSVIRTFRVLRALKTVAIIPGMKTIVGAVIDSVKNLKDVVVLTLFSLSVFSLLGLQIYMGTLTQKCILNSPNENMTDSEWHEWNSNSSHWVPEPDDEIFGGYRLCGNATGAQSCPENHTCLQGFGPNPDYGFTNFDTFGWALICSFRLMTQDFWEGLYMQILKTVGSWHIIFFILSIFLGSIYLMNLILAIVAMSYNELQRRAEEEEEAAAEDEAAFLESCRLMEMQEQMSEYSTSTLNGGGGPTGLHYGSGSAGRNQANFNTSSRASYRPSVEIGLVGQSLLASLCQNGLLGEKIREKLNQQIILPGYGYPMAQTATTMLAGARSHSLSVQPHEDFVCGEHPINLPLNPTPFASSMTELRRKSSLLRTKISEVEQQDQQTSDSGNTAQTGSRLYVAPSSPSLSYKRNSLSKLKRTFSNKLSIPTTSSSSEQHRALQQPYGNKLSSARPSTTSDHDLCVLRQRAALIRIENRDAVNEAKSLDFVANADLLAPNSSKTQPNRSALLNIRSKFRTKSHDYSLIETSDAQSSLSQAPCRAGSEAAICKQPRSIHEIPTRSSMSEQQQMLLLQQKQKRLSNCSSDISDSSDQLQLNKLAQLKYRNQHQAIMGGSTRTLHQRNQHIKQLLQPSGQATATAPLAPKVSSSGNLKQLCVDRCFQNQNLSLVGQDAADKMHHLSVENFQQFGQQSINRLPGRPVSRASAGNLDNLQRGSIHSVHQSTPNAPPPSLDRHRSMSSSNYCSSGEMGDFADLAQPRFGRGRLESRGYIHPSIMMRSSIGRPRHSIIASTSGGQQRISNQQARRVSQDFVRRASDWSRMSVSGNVDLRRLLRLWSHTNPYQGRPSIGSFHSNFSGQGGGFNGGDPQKSCNQSPRPSSVGSTRQAYELISAFNRRHNRVVGQFNNQQQYSSIPLDDNMMLVGDKISITARDKCIAYCLNCLDILCIWECCGLWLKIQNLISVIVFDPFTELFIILCICINTLFMALDSDDADAQMKMIFERGNYFFTATFAVEASMKIMALSPKFYFREGWNVFDSIIVGLSLLELGLEGVYGLSVLRTFRLLRVFKLAKSWPTLNLLISIMGKAVGDLGNLTFVLAIIVFIFAVMGMQLFGNKYIDHNFPSGELPRWNFTDFMHSFMIVFRILCAEWIEPMWDCLLVGGWPCIPFFLIAVTVGNLVVLNLFLALLLASFGASNLSSPQAADNVDTKKLQEAIARFSRFGRWLKRKFCNLLRRLVAFLLCREYQSNRKNLNDIRNDDEDGKRGNQIKSRIAAMSKLERMKNIEIRTEELKSKIRRSPEHHYHLRQLAQSQLKETNKAVGKGFNYHYELHQQQLTIANSKQMSNPVPIPIIVNDTDYSNSNQSKPEKNDPDRKSSSDYSNQAVASFDNSNKSPSPREAIQYAETPVKSNKSSLSSSYNYHNMQVIREDSRDNDSNADDSVSIEEFSWPKSRSNLDKLALEEARLLNSDVQKFPPGEETNKSDYSQYHERLVEATELEPEVVKASDRIDTEDGLEKEGDEEERPKSSLYLKAPKRQDMEEDDEKTLQYIESYIERCICFGILCLKWFLFRQYVRKIVEHRYFDQCILILIVISSGTLALEDKHLNERPTLKRTLDVLDTIFTIIFSLEMVFKWLAFGMKRYFGNIWSWLDFIIVLVSFVNLMASIFGSGKIQALKTMRTLRAMRGLRPLRALQRFQGMRVVVNALIQAIPSIFNVLLVCLIFWLIFSIMGVQMFGGKFWRCLDPKTQKVVSYEEAANKFECIDRNLTWANPQINFDNVLNAYLALFQVATFKGWIDIMNSATDSRNRDDQPIREANIYMYFYFVFFVIVGSFFTLNLFIGVIIDNFNEQKKKTGGSLEIFMTEDQKKYYHAMKKMKSKRPTKAMTRPKFKLQAYMFDITTSKKFDMVIMLIIGLNMFVMALEHYGQSQEFSLVLETLNLIFIAIFTLECLCKIFAMRHFYFREPWNIFDFIVVIFSILGVVMKEYVAKYLVSPTLLRVVRVVKVGRVLRLVKGAKGIRTLLFALAMSLPALFNICLLLFLVMFIYAIFGMSFFMNVRKRSGIDETFNFETFSSSIIVLFQMSTSAGWDIVLDPLMDEENDCQKPDPAQNIEGTCGNKEIAIFYLISYVIVTFLIIINMYIAVILENYSQATEDVQEGLTDDDYEMYYEIWQKFDPNGTQYLPYEKLSDFVDALEDPLRIAKPNELALVVLDINIYEGNQCYCVDILDALTKYFFTRKGLVIQVNEHLQNIQSILHETPFERITTTYLLKRQHYCAKVIQNCWRKWKQRALSNEKSSSAINQYDSDNNK